MIYCIKFIITACIVLTWLNITTASGSKKISLQQSPTVTQINLEKRLNVY